MWQALLQGLGHLLSSLYDLAPNYGVAIILLTVVIRIALIPLAIKQIRMMEVTKQHAEKMRKIQPELKKLQEKHKDDRQKLYEESKKLQDEHGVSLMGGFSGCLPTLLQFPILIAMYRMLTACGKFVGKTKKCLPGYAGVKYLPAGSALRAAMIAGQTGFLGMNLASTPSDVQKSLGVIEALPYYLLIAAMAGTMWYQQKQMSKAGPQDPQSAQMQKVMMIMPVMFVFWSVNFPAGLTLYWVATNIWSIGQQSILYKRFGPGQAKSASGQPSKESPSPNGQPNVASPVASPVNGSQPARPAAQRPKGSGARKKKRSKK